VEVFAVHTTAQLPTVLDAAKGKRVVVIGDLYLDVYISGEMRGISPEAPVPLIEDRQRRYVPGGAGNVAAGLVALGADVAVIGTNGDDAHSAGLGSVYRRAGIDVEGIVTLPDTSANMHTRITTSEAHLPDRAILRLDTPVPALVHGSAEAEIGRRIDALCSTADAVVIVESSAGVCSTGVLERAQSVARERGILLIGDVAGRAKLLRGYDVVLPNQREAAELLGVEEAALNEIGRRLLSEHENAAVVVTRGGKGMTIFTAGGRDDVATTGREVFDVTGAGDTVTAAFTMAMLGGSTLRGAAQIANIAAYVAVGHAGLHTVSAQEMLHASVELTLRAKGGKLHSRDELAAIVRAAQAGGKRIAFTNGCFDLLHPGHVTYLQQAADVADGLIVALNSDVSVRTLKGPTRPILKQDERVMILSALESVRWITLFDETRITDLLDTIRPDFWVKGGDYTLDSLDAGERAMADKHGCEIVLIPPVEGISTTGIMERIEEAKRRAGSGGDG
jgi:D-beta-D-heptose 7-phosphate kinase/D-beta-D-heptose 1-phosphate adenosyltransferase